jgi:hypothetical protein
MLSHVGFRSQERGKFRAHPQRHDLGSGKVYEAGYISQLVDLHVANENPSFEIGKGTDHDIRQIIL